MRFYRPVFPVRWIYSGSIFRVRTDQKVLYLTFDDGPDRNSTEIILEILAKYNIKAVFFMNGIAAEKSPDLVNLIRSGGHLTGNHGWDHSDGWKTPANQYVQQVRKAEKATSTTLFRPPYGHLTLSQFRVLKNQYRIVFWDVMPYDFDRHFEPGKSLEILKKKLRPGSVIVLHDNKDSSSVSFLEEFILYAVEKGYSFDNKLV